MKLSWYINRLKKMSPSEIFKRAGEHAAISYDKVRLRNPDRWPYERFAGNNTISRINSVAFENNACAETQFSCYGNRFDFTKPIDWYFSDQTDKKWPKFFFNAINYRPGNPYGDVRINWELNRLQFLPNLMLADETRATEILENWLEKNPFMHGPAYIATMEVALRWISIYRAVCMMKKNIDSQLEKRLAGLAVASGRCIVQRLSTHSSAGNHLIVEAVGLFWIGKALGDVSIAKKWRRISRDILWEQVPAQIQPDGTPQEQSFWYLGFVLDSICQYLVLEKKELVPPVFLERILRAIQFVDDLLLADGSYPDFGDRDDGYAVREEGNYQTSIFKRVSKFGEQYFNENTDKLAKDRIEPMVSSWPDGGEGRTIKTYPNGGMTSMQQGAGRLLFRHSRLGLGNTCGHGHADALSVLLWWNQKPVLIDVGSGQYNGSQDIRNYFRSTIAHNTIEIGGKSQAEIIGPFLWRGSYATRVVDIGSTEDFFVEAEHDGYQKDFSLIHRRKVKWQTTDEIVLTDSFHGNGTNTMRGAFHLGPSREVEIVGSSVAANFNEFQLKITFPEIFGLAVRRGSKHPLIGWRSKMYGEWQPMDSIVFTGNVQAGNSFTINLKIESKSK